jgi:hypothetical protein
MPTTGSHDQAREVTAARVAAGVAWLDLHQPGWRERVDPSRLDMSGGTYLRADPGRCGCVAAQLDILGSYSHFVLANSGLGGPEELAETQAVHAWAVAHGLDLPAAHGFADDAEAWAALTAAWREALGPAGEEPATADPAVVSPTDEGVGFDV